MLVVKHIQWKSVYNKGFKMVNEINTEETYKAIKKQNGEEFAKVLRANVLLGIPNLKHILEYAGKSAEDANGLIPILREIRDTSSKPVIKQEVINKDPIELLKDAGYNAFYVRNAIQKNSIKKYFRPGEELCTFSDSTRHHNYFIIHAVKHGAENIKPSKHPEREDEYGTSVISIQIAKAGGFISIKNRYNHNVNNPDATFSNNPDNIIMGLTESLKKKFGVDFVTHEARMPHNYRVINDQLVRFNYEEHNVYFDEKYYFEGSSINKLNTDYEIMLDYVILDTRTGQTRNVLSGNIGANNMVRVLDDEISGHRIKTEKDKTTSETIINIIDENKKSKELARVKNGCVTSLHLYKTTEIGNRFFCYNKDLKKLYAPKLKKTGDYCFNRNMNLESLYVPELEDMGNGFFYNSDSLKELDLPKLKKMGFSCFSDCHQLKKINIPELEEMGYACLGQMYELTELNMPKIKKIANGCFCYNGKLNKLYIPELTEIGDDVFANIKNLHEINAPKLKKTGITCFGYCTAFVKVYAPELEELGNYCFEEVKVLMDFCAPKLKITKNTPKCILNYLKLEKIKNGIKKILTLSGRAKNKNAVAEMSSSQQEL